jgi:hypothetical protein
MSAITFRIQGPPAAVEQSAAGLKEIFGLITELTESSDDGQTVRKLLTVNGRLNHIGQICLTVGEPKRADQ